MTKDLTNGNPLKLIIAFSIPALFGNLFQQFYNMVDSIIVGQYIGKNALAAVGSTGCLNFLVIGFVIGICSGFNILVSQTFGAGDEKNMRGYIANGGYLCVFFTVLLTALTMVFTKPLLRAMHTPEEILEDAYSYVIIIFAGIAAIMMYNYLACILRALGDSKTPLYFLILASIVNVVLDLVFILHFHMGVKGAGYATVIAQGLSGILCLLYIWKRYPILRFQKGELSFDLHKCLRLIYIGVPMALQFSITAIGSIILQIAVNQLGATSVAAVTAANRLQIMFTQPMETLGITMATFCGQNLGAGKKERIHQGVKTSTIITVVYSLLLCMIMLIFAPKLSLLFVNAKETAVLAESALFLRINSLFYITLGILFIYRNSLQGMGYSISPMFAGLLELIGRSVVAICFVGTFHFYAICMASPVAWILADILLVTLYIIKIVLPRKREKLE